MIIKVVGASSNSFSSLYKKDEGEFLIGVDGGVDTLIKKNLKIDLAIGDFDSSSTVRNISKHSRKVIQYNTEKDESDLELALTYISSPEFSNNHKLKKMIRKITLYNVTGKRLDHYHAAINLLIRYMHLPIEIVDKFNRIKIVNSKTVFKKDDYKYISFFAIDPNTKITLTGFKYPLTNYELSTQDNIGLSNEIINDLAILETNNKKIIVFQSK